MSSPKKRKLDPDKAESPNYNTNMSEEATCANGSTLSVKLNLKKPVLQHSKEYAG